MAPNNNPLRAEVKSDLNPTLKPIADIAIVRDILPRKSMFFNKISGIEKEETIIEIMINAHKYQGKFKCFFQLVSLCYIIIALFLIIKNDD